MRLHTLIMAGLVAHVAQALASTDQAHQNQERAQFDATTATAATATAVSSTSSAVPTQTIAVGATGNTFTPNNVSVAVGTVVEFNFYPGNHSVVRSAYKFPCIPYENTGPNLVGFYSGFKDTNVYSSDGPKYRIRINNTDPIFYYCSAPASCMDHIMIGAINANATWTLATQEEYAANTTIQLTPGDPLPSEVAPSATSTAAAAAAASRGHNVGEIVGISVGVVAAGLAVLALAGWCCVRRSPCLQRRLQERRQRDQKASRNRSQNDDGNYDDGNGNGRSNPMSPLSPSSRNGTPGSASMLKYSTSPSPLGVHTQRRPTPVMADMTEYMAQTNYRHRTPPPVPPMPPMQPMPPMAQMPHSMSQTGLPVHYTQHMPYHLPQQQQPQMQPHQHYYPGLPVYSNVPPHMSPLQSHPLYDRPCPPPPVELPTAVALSSNVAVPARSSSKARGNRHHYVSNYTVSSAAAPAANDSRSPPPARKESPTIGGVAQTPTDKDRI